MESTIASRIKADRRGVLSSLWIFAVEILALLAIIGLSWTWRPDPAEPGRDAVVAS